jgi:hypothetical protein
MNLKRPRVPLTHEQRVKRLIAVTTEHSHRAGLYYQPIAHDDWCPALRTHSLRDCRCEPVFAAPVRLDSDGSEGAR